MEIINGMFSGGIVAVLCGIVFFGIPKIFEGLIYKGLEFKIQKAIAESNVNAAVELEKLKNENQKKLQEELEKIKLENTKKINTLQIEFQMQYQNAEQNFIERIDLLKMKYTVLPKLYENFLVSYSRVVSDYFLKNDNAILASKSINELKSFIMLNRFYLTDEMYKDCIECKDLLVEMFEKRIDLSDSSSNYDSESAEEIFEVYTDDYNAKFDTLTEKIALIMR